MFCETQETMKTIVPDIAHRLFFKANVRFRKLKKKLDYFYTLRTDCFKVCKYLKKKLLVK